MNLEKEKPQILLEAKKISFSYGEKMVLKNVSFRLKANEIIGIVGGSGSGKTSLLKILGGFLSPDKGVVFLDGNSLKNSNEKLILGEEKIKLVNQDFDLMPFISVDENIASENLSQSESARKKMLGEYHRKLQIGNIKNQKAERTSGGQQQRVAMAKALSVKPEVLLLDEPFSNLDFSLKNRIIELLQTRWKAKGIIVVAHEPMDILKMADRILVMDKGRIIQEGSSQELYHKPKNQYVAELLGPVNVLESIEAQDLGINNEGDKKVYLRPNKLKTVHKNGLKAEVLKSHYYGAYYILECYVKKWDKILKVQAAANKSGKVSLGLKHKI